MAKVAIDIGGGRLKQKNVIVGIDLGTTNSLIARVVDGQPEAIADYDKDVIVPSVIHFENSSPTVGESAKPQLIEDPENTIYSVKRLMGKSLADVEQQSDFFSYEVIGGEGEDELVRVRVGDTYYTPTELSSVILKELKGRAEHRLKTELQQAVITVPAYFNDTQRQATRDAGKLAGLDVLRILNEPTAAALAYGLGKRGEEAETVAVYDLGGGTFDVTILSITDGVFEVQSTNGDTYLGGDDFDRAIVRHWQTQLGISDEQLREDRSFNQSLRLAAEKAKKLLSVEDSFSTELQGLGQTYTLELTKSQFDELIEPDVQRTLTACKRAMKDAALTAKDIDQVILVGGSTRVPRVNAAVGELFGKQPNDSLDPDKVVAYGAAVQADILAGNRTDMLLLDVTPLSLGIETLGGLMDSLIPRNSKVPSTASRQYTTSVDGQVNLKVNVFQGERELVSDNRKLAEFDLQGIPAMPAGLPKIEIKFLIDADGILRVSAKELRSGVEQTIDVKPTYGLNDDQVEKMLLDSLQNAEDDVSKRMLEEARQEGKQMVYNARNFVKKYGEVLSEDEKTRNGAPKRRLGRVDTRRQQGCHFERH